MASNRSIDKATRRLRGRRHYHGQCLDLRNVNLLRPFTLIGRSKKPNWLVKQSFGGKKTLRQIFADDSGINLVGEHAPAQLMAHALVDMYRNARERFQDISDRGDNERRRQGGGASNAESAGRRGGIVRYFRLDSVKRYKKGACAFHERVACLG